MAEEYDFAGYATRANMRCSDGRIIAKDAFKHQDGQKVPLVWNHNHSTPDTVLGYGILHSANGDMRVECFFNDTDSGLNSKKLVLHKDITALSIYANQLKEEAKTVIHGMIREVSLVYAGANPGAMIDSVVYHSDGTSTTDPEQGIIYTGEFIELPLELAHADDGEEQKEAPSEKADPEGEESYQDVMNTLTEKQRNVVAAVMATVLDQEGNAESEAEKSDSEVKHSETEEEEDPMKKNLFDQETVTNDAYLSHADGVAIIKMAKEGDMGLKQAMKKYITEQKKELAHAADDLGFADIHTLFPDPKLLNPGAPEMLTTDQGWISEVLNGTHKSPISRIRTRYADVRNIENLRAKGYVKGTEKGFRGNISLLGRTTEPTTVFVKNQLHRDDVVDITDFDIVQYQYSIDRMDLNEELATAIVLGDGRVEGTDGKIDETKIRPVWTDDELYTIHADVDLESMRTELQGTNTAANFGENYIYAESIIQTLLYAREKYKGSGSPMMLIHPHTLNIMLLARDLNGRRIYDSVNELKAALNVSKIVTVEQFEDRTREVTVRVPVQGGGTQDVVRTKKLLALVYNFSDYHVGATKGGEISHFTDFDLNFNKLISLIETRLSGANTRPFSAIALEEDVTENP
jgi:hypothetical protein